MDWLMYGMTTALGATLMGVALFLILRVWLCDVEARLKVVVRATLCAMLIAWVFPLAVISLRGEGVLPPWAAWFLMLFALMVLASYWRTVLNRWEAGGKSPLDQMMRKKPDAQIQERIHTEAELHEMEEPDVPFHGEKSNLLADIAREHSQRETAGKEQQEDHVTAQVEEPVDSMPMTEGELPQESAPVEADQNNVACEEAINPTDDHISETEEMGLVIHPDATRLTLREIVIRAWDARESGQTQEAFSWFLSGLATRPGKTVRDELLLDACALLHEHEQGNLTRALLESEYAEGMEESLRERIRSSVSINRNSSDSGQK